GEGGGWQSLSEGRGASEPSEKARRPLSLPPPLGAPLIWERRHPETTTCLSAHLPPDSCLSALLSSIALTCGICATPPRSRGCPLQDRSTRRRPPRRALLRGLGAGSLESTRALLFRSSVCLPVSQEAPGACRNACRRRTRPVVTIAAVSPPLS
ncbi:unnamed protein product, partial [Prorocentrum cordatum]